MKKYLALLLSVMMLLSLTAAFAEDIPVAPSTTEGAFTKKFEGAVPTTETLTFKTEFVGEKVTGSTTPPDVAVLPATITLPLDGAHTDGVFNVPFTVTAPNAYGTYIYKITEVIPDGAANGPITYDTEALYVAVLYTASELTVTLINDPNAAATTDLNPSDRTVDASGDGKKDQFVNSYKIGAFEVKKVLAGNAANLNDTFVVEVTFTSTVDLDNLEMTMLSSAAANAEATAVGITSLTANTPVTKNIELGHNEIYTFENVPVGVTISVEETNQVGKDDLNFYVASYDVNDITVTEESQLITITNTKETEIPTGIELDSIPYIVMLAVVVLGVVAFIVKRRLAAADED